MSKTSKRNKKIGKSGEISKTSVFKNVAIYSTYLIIFWAFYRFLFQFPDNIEEIFVKPIFWIIPLLFIIKKEKVGISSLGFTFKNLAPSVLLSLGLGAVFVIEGLATNFVKYGHFNFAANFGSAAILATFGISIITAITEETSFRGYIFSRLAYVFKNETLANIVQTVLWIAIHIPIAFFVLNLNLSQALVYLSITGIFGLGSAFIFARTNNIWGSVLLHVLWEWPIILFR